jgi:hypothetical protein
LIDFLHQRLGLAFAVLRLDGGGKLWGCHVLQQGLLEKKVLLEPTGGANSAANGKAERTIGVISP